MEIVSNEWNKLVRDCREIMVVTVKKTRKEMLEGHYLLGKRIIEYRTNFTDVGTPLNQEELANALEIKQQRISEVIAFAEYADRKFGSFEGFLEYYKDRTELPPWGEIVHWYLPFNLYPKELEDKTLKSTEIPTSLFSSEEEAKKWFEDRDGIFEGVFYKGKIAKNRGS